MLNKIMRCNKKINIPEPIFDLRSRNLLSVSYCKIQTQGVSVKKITNEILNV